MKRQGPEMEARAERAAGQGGRARRFRRGVLVLLGGTLIGVLGLVLAVCAVPYPRERLTPARATSLEIRARDGRLLRRLPLDGGGRAQWAASAQVPPLLLSAVLASEDRRFFDHHGVDGLALLRAAWLNLRARRLAFGGSTLTMQLVRLLEPPGAHRPRSLLHKLGEILDALRLERSASKQEILEQYLNRAYFGSGAVGVTAAASRYFRRPLAELSAAEATLLSVLPRAPLSYDPRRRLDAAVRRRGHVLELLVGRGLLTPEERSRITSSPLSITATAEALPDAEPAPHAPFLAPHFVDHVLSTLDTLAPGARLGGGTVHTTLDLALQARVEGLVREHVAGLRSRNLSQAGVVVLDSATGEVRALVGSADYFDPAAHGQINILTTPRHPGSALKPFTYALAIEQGDTPASIALDIAESAPGSTRGLGRQHGPVRYRDALPCSYNLAALHVASRVGPSQLLLRLRDAGLDTLDRAPAAYGPELTLGSDAVRLLDLAAAYTFLTQEGLVRPARAITKITRPGSPDSSLAIATAPPRRLFSPEVSFLLTDILADPEARRPAFGDELPFDLPFRIAAKTGTSAGYSDNLAIITTTEYTVAAWAGNFDGRRMYEVLAMQGAAPLARAALLAAAGDRALTLPRRPPGIVQARVCSLSGQRPGPACPGRTELFIAGHTPSTTCTWHAADGAVAWPRELSRWAAARPR